MTRRTVKVVQARLLDYSFIHHDDPIEDSDLMSEYHPDSEHSGDYIIVPPGYVVVMMRGTAIANDTYDPSITTAVLDDDHTIIIDRRGEE